MDNNLLSVERIYALRQLRNRLVEELHIGESERALPGISRELRQLASQIEEIASNEIGPIERLATLEDCKSVLVARLPSCDPRYIASMSCELRLLMGEIEALSRPDEVSEIDVIADRVKDRS